MAEDSHTVLKNTNTKKGQDKKRINQKNGINSLACRGKQQNPRLPKNSKNKRLI